MAGLSHFNLIKVADICLAAGPTAATNFTFKAPVSCKFHSLQSAQETTGQAFLTASLAVNGTTIVTGTAITVAGSAATNVVAVDAGKSDLILDTDRITINLTNGGSATGVFGVTCGLWCQAKPRG